MAASPQFVATLKTPSVVFVNADATAFKPVIVAGASGTRIDTLFASASDGVNANVVQLSIQVAGVDHVIGEVALPAGSGTNGVAKSVGLLNPTAIPGLANTEGGALFLASGAVLRARVKTAVAGANSVHISGVAGDY